MAFLHVAQLSGLEVEDGPCQGLLHLRCISNATLGLVVIMEMEIRVLTIAVNIKTTSSSLTLNSIFHFATGIWSSLFMMDHQRVLLAQCVKGPACLVS